jgi:PIN domain nuclease of toxin-antitoxin system
MFTKPRRSYRLFCWKLNKKAKPSSEIGIKYRAGKLKLPVPPSQWLAGVMEHHEIATIDLTTDICLKASELPPIHGDPCDRFIIATALMNNTPIVTADRRFHQYGLEVLI